MQEQDEGAASQSKGGAAGTSSGGAGTGNATGATGAGAPVGEVRPINFRGGRGTRPKGRAVDPEALQQVRALLGAAPRERDLLIEHLHLLQDRYGHLSAPHLVALAAEMRMAPAEVYEVATFYHHFDVVKEGDDIPPRLTVRVCDSISCELAGSQQLIDELHNQGTPDCNNKDTQNQDNMATDETSNEGSNDPNPPPIPGPNYSSYIIGVLTELIRRSEPFSQCSHFSPDCAPWVFKASLHTSK